MKDRIDQRARQRGEAGYSDEEVARRRDAVVRRMLNTPPQPHQTKRAKDTKQGRAESTVTASLLGVRRLRFLPGIAGPTAPHP